MIKKLLIYIYRKAKAWEKVERHSILRKKYNISKSFRFNGDDIQFYGTGDIHIGDNTYIGNLSTIQVSKPYSVIIGKNCAISHNVRIYTVSIKPDNDWSNNEKVIKGGDVIIKDYAWIGANVFINPGITIGENAVIGANSVVTRDVEPFSIVGGVPAKLIRMKNLNA